jgi:hypothetical protein
MRKERTDKITAIIFAGAFVVACGILLWLRFTNATATENTTPMTNSVTGVKEEKTIEDYFPVVLNKTIRKHIADHNTVMTEKCIKISKCELGDLEGECKMAVFQCGPPLYYLKKNILKNSVVRIESKMNGIVYLDEPTTEMCMPGTVPNDQWEENTKGPFGRIHTIKKVCFGSAQTATKTYDDCIIVTTTWPEDVKAYIKTYYARGVGWVMEQNELFTSQLVE